MASKTITASFSSDLAYQSASVKRTYAVDMPSGSKEWTPTSTTSLTAKYEYPLAFGFDYSSLDSLVITAKVTIGSSNCSSSKKVTVSVLSNSSSKTALITGTEESKASGTYTYTLTLTAANLATLKSEGATGVLLFVQAKGTGSRTTCNLPSAGSYATGYSISKTHNVNITVNPADLTGAVTYTVPPTVNYYNGSKWVACVPFYYDGSKWVECEAKYYNGSTWKNLTKG